MFFHIAADNGLAIYDQVVRQIKFAVAGEVLKAGDLAPSAANQRESWRLILTRWAR